MREARTFPSPHYPWNLMLRAAFLTKRVALIPEGRVSFQALQNTLDTRADTN